MFERVIGFVDFLILFLIIFYGLYLALSPRKKIASLSAFYNILVKGNIQRFAVAFLFAGLIHFGGKILAGRIYPVLGQSRIGENLLLSRNGIALLIEGFVVFAGFFGIFYYRLFQKLSPDIKKIERKGFLYNLLLITLILISNAYFWHAAGSVWETAGILFINLIFTLLFLVVSVLNLHLYIRRGKTSEEILLQTLHNQTMEAFMDEIKRIKHNYNNTIATLGGYVKLKKWERMGRYLQEMNTDFFRIDSLGVLSAMRIRNAALMGVLNSKMLQAEKAGVVLRVECDTEIENMRGTLAFFCDVLGNLLDLSILEAASSDDRQIHLNIHKEEACLVFSVYYRIHHGEGKLLSKKSFCEISFENLKNKTGKNQKMNLETHEIDGYKMSKLSLEQGEIVEKSA